MATDTRLSTAAQFFMDEDDASTVEMKSTYDRVVELLNQASLLQKDEEKTTNLKMVQELIVNKEPALLDGFLDEMLAFQSDRSQDVKKAVVSFIEEACKKDPEILPKVTPHIIMMMSEDIVGVTKRIVLAMGQVYKVALQWLAKAKTHTDEMEQTWTTIQKIKQEITEMIDSDNDGVRTYAVKFLEILAITLTRRSMDSDIPKKNKSDISLEQISENKRLIPIKKLEDDGKKAFDTILNFMGSPHLSSVNLMTCMGSLTNFAKQRPQYIPRVVHAYEALHVNLPPTLAKSQVSSVRKNLKMQMLQLLKHPASYELQPQITTLLTDLGATQSEVMRNLPKIDESRKRKLEESAPVPAATTSVASTSKKPKLEIPLTLKKVVDDDDDDLPLGVSSRKETVDEDKKQNAIDITSEDLVARLTPQNVADLVLLSMVMLPESMPAHFQSTYTPIAAAGTPAQINHLSRLLATQLTAANLGKGYDAVGSQKPKKKKVPTATLR